MAKDTVTVMEAPPTVETENLALHIVCIMDACCPYMNVAVSPMLDKLFCV